MKVPRSRRRGKSRIFQVNPGEFKVRIIKNENPMTGRIVDLIDDPYRTAPIEKIKFEDGSISYLPAFNGAYVGMNVSYLNGSDSIGSIERLKDIPVGSTVYNIELRPNDGGKLIRAGGETARIVEKSGGKVSIQLPSSKIVYLDENCRAVIGTIANAGRRDKPFYKAGNKYHAMKARGRYWPLTAAVAMNAYEHKFGGKRRSTQHKSKSVSRNAPPGAKVGSIAPRRTGMKR
ncbi:MAG: 50S ribosomal protein L2 [Nanoarchaeota archaeon]|nr:50S ribosomal protein L2 [Nanoarchaeota archaeon]